MRWPLVRRQEISLQKSSRRDGRNLELEAAKEILGEIFSIDNAEVEEMIWMRLEERPLYDLEFRLDESI
jgi:hypothetical protein